MMDFQLFYETTGICTDTRKIEKDCLFICLKGANFNGNEFAEKALEAGAKYVIADEDLFPGNERIKLVDNALEYLQKLANHHRRKFNIPVIGITGSNGKTTTKELVTTVLSKTFKVLCTQGNLNNHIGVPLTLLKLTETHEIAVVEMGANKFNDIQELCEIAEPTHGIITNIGRAHLEGFLNFEGVLKTKLELYDSVSASKGIIFFNADDDILSSHLPQNVSKISYSSINSADVSGELLNLNPYVNMRWKMEGYESEAIQTQMIGKYNFYNFLAAICIGSYFGVQAELISEAIASYAPSNNRSQIEKTGRNTLIMDAYNANPTSMTSALESFAFIDHEDKLAILGDMFELGEESAEEHQKIMNLIHFLNLPALCIGERFQQANPGTDPLVHTFVNKEEARNYLTANPISNKLVLLKGSRGIGLETLVDLL